MPNFPQVSSIKASKAENANKVTRKKNNDKEQFSSDCTSFLSVYQNIHSSPSAENPESEEGVNNIEGINNLESDSKSLMTVSLLPDKTLIILENAVSNTGTLNPGQENQFLSGKVIQSNDVPGYIDSESINITSGEESLFQLQTNVELFKAAEDEATSVYGDEIVRSGIPEINPDSTLVPNAITNKNTSLGLSKNINANDSSDIITEIDQSIDQAIDAVSDNTQVNQAVELLSDNQEDKTGLKIESKEGPEQPDSSKDNNNLIFHSSENKLIQPENAQEFSIHNNDEMGNREITFSEIDKSDVLKQVIDKANVFIDGEKSEMVIELKPDSLGKLSLKVVSERGLVEANFIAENNQVKEILETNMNLLKDVLEKQGIVVQGFSVSVGDHSAGSFGRDERTAKERDKINIASIYSDIGESAVADYHGQDSKIDIYKLSGRKIDLTA